jgi:hypothetical protein
LNVLATITGNKAGFRSLGDTWADTTASHGRLMLFEHEFVIAFGHAGSLAQRG